MRRLPVIIAIGSTALLGCDRSYSYSIEGGFPPPGSSDDGGPTPPPLGPTFDGGPPVVRPDFGSIGTASTPPPAISGGTLLVLADGKTAVAADPDRDAVYVVDTVARKLVATVALEAGDEPGRSAEDASGRVHVALRGSGALATIDPASGMIVARRAVCPSPRGVAYDATKDALWVACATGELVSLPAAGGPATATLKVERDLRDVIVQNGALTVSEFRSADVLQVASDGTISSRTPMPVADPRTVPHVAWRMAASPSGALVVVHQEESTASIPTSQPGAYGDQLGGGPVETIVSFPGLGTSVQLPDMVLPVDIAVSASGDRVAVVAAGNTFVQGFSNLMVLTSGQIAFQEQIGGNLNAQATAVAFDGAGDIVVQTREPAGLWFVGSGGSNPTGYVALSTTSRADLAHAVFHIRAGAAIACATCHPEGGDDGHVWMFNGQQRRTPSLRGTIGGTAPYHWPGDEPDLGALANDVYTVRMDGAPLDPNQLTALQTWVEAIPAPAAPSWLDAAAVQRGKAIFERADVACSSCHSGPKFTDNATLDVGTGGLFQVPPLVGVGWRTPLLHDGCAATLAQRFDVCATPQHGSIGSLSSADVSDVVAYLESL